MSRPLELVYHGFARRPLGAGPGEEPAAEAVVLDPWVFHAPWLEALTSRISALASLPAGISAGELEGRLRVDAEALRAVLAFLVDKGALLLTRGLYFCKGAAEKRELSALAQNLLTRIVEAGRAGFESNRTGIAGAQKELKALARQGLIVALEGGICYARQTYGTLVSEVLSGRNRGERFSIPEAKERTGLSRKFMIPLLNRMEGDGLLMREGDARVVQ